MPRRRRSRSRKWWPGSARWSRQSSNRASHHERSTSVSGPDATSPAPGVRARPALFDANVLVGPLPRRPPSAPEDVAALGRVMDDYGLDRALVAHTYAKWFAPPAGN